MKPRWTLRKHYARGETYPIDLSAWLNAIGDTLESYTVTAPAGLSATHAVVNNVVSLAFENGTVGRLYVVAVRAVAANGDVMTVEIACRVHGAGQVVVESEAVTLITGLATATGAAVARPGAEWSYELLVEADAAGASAEFRIRVGNTNAAALTFGPNENYTVTVTVSATPDGDGKYRGAAEEEGNQAWSYHAADIVAIAGTNTVATVTGVPQ